MEKCNQLIKEIQENFSRDLESYLKHYEGKPLEQMPYYRISLGYQEEA